MTFDGTDGGPLSVDGSVDARGIAKLSVTFFAPTLVAAFGVAPRDYEGLQLTGISLSKLPGGAYNATGTYEGGSPGGIGGGTPSAQGGEESATYELDFSQAQKPIQVHPDFATPTTGLRDRYKWGPLDKDNSAWGFQAACPSGVSPVVGESGSMVNPLHGVTDWLDVGAVWRKSWMETAAVIPVSLFYNLGRVDSPMGPVPVVGQGRNWIKSAAKARGRGKVWECTNEWLLSGRGGHEPAIYMSKK